MNGTCAAINYAAERAANMAAIADFAEIALAKHSDCPVRLQRIRAMSELRRAGISNAIAREAMASL